MRELMKKLLSIMALFCIGTKGSSDGATQHQLIIIGSGPAGLTAAIYAARSKLNPLVIEGMPSILSTVSSIENWPCYEKISGRDLIKSMTDHAKKTGAHLIADEVTEVNIKKRPFILKTARGQTLSTQALIVATGMSPKKIGCPGEKEYFGRGVANCAMCDAPFFKDQTVIIAGGGIMALQNIALLNKYAKKVIIINNKASLSGPPDLIEHVKKLEQDHPEKVEILPNQKIVKIIGDDEGVTSVEVTDKNNKTHTIKTSGVFISMGYEPCTDLFKGKLPTGSEGRIKTDPVCHTSIPGLFVAGNAATIPHGQAIVCASSGCIAAIEAEKYLERNPKKPRLPSCQKS